MVIKGIGFDSQPVLSLPAAVVPGGASEDALENVEAGLLKGINPLQLALAAAAISNEGIRPAPSIDSAIETPDGKWEPYYSRDEPVQVFPPEAAAEAAIKLSEPNSQFWEVVAMSPPGLADTNKNAGTWYLAGSNLSTIGVPISLALHLEQENPELAVQIGQTIIRQVLEIYP